MQDQEVLDLLHDHQTPESHWEVPISSIKKNRTLFLFSATVGEEYQLKHLTALLGNGSGVTVWYYPQAK